MSRPFASLRTTTSKGGEVGDLGGVVAALGRLELRTSGQAPTVLARPADLAGSDLRLDLALEALVGDGRLVRKERRVIAGRPCQVYRSSGPLEGTGNLTAPDGADVTETCVDGRGLVLAELAFSGKTVLRQQIATAVDEAPAIIDAELAVGDPTVPANRGGAGFVAVPEGTGPVGRTFVLDVPPTGFTRIGRFADVDAQTNNPQGLPTGDRRTGFTEVWTSGRDVLILDQGSTKGGSAPFGTDRFARPVDLAGLGMGEAVTGTAAPAVRVNLGGGTYVRVAGTLPVDRLAEVARTLRSVEVPVPG